MSYICPNCNKEFEENIQKCPNCGYKRKTVYKKKNIQSSNALARKQALEKKNVNVKTTPVVKKVISQNNNDREDTSTPPEMNNDNTDIKTKNNNLDKQLEENLNTESANIGPQKPIKISDVETEKNGLLLQVKKKMIYTFTKERKIEKRIEIDNELNFDHYYDDVIGEERCIAEGVDIHEVIKIVASVAGYFALIIFLIYWL